MRAPCHQPIRDARVPVNGLFVLSGSNANSLSPSQVCIFWPRTHPGQGTEAPAGLYLPEGVEGEHMSRSVTLNVSGNSHKEAMSGDKMFYFPPQSLASKWQAAEFF